MRNIEDRRWAINHFDRTIVTLNFEGSKINVVSDGDYYFD